jgi:hypothetical protein
MGMHVQIAGLMSMGVMMVALVVGYRHRRGKHSSDLLAGATHGQNPTTRTLSRAGRGG